MAEAFHWVIPIEMRLTPRKHAVSCIYLQNMVFKKKTRTKNYLALVLAREYLTQALVKHEGDFLNSEVPFLKLMKQRGC